MKVIGVIPARLKSTRLAEKVKREVAGKPLVQHVWERASKATKLNQVVIATDHQDIIKMVERFGGKACLTRPDHQSGTERLIEVAQNVECDVIINIQGDEPLIDSSSIDRLVDVFNDECVKVGTLYYEMTNVEAFESPNVVKVVLDHAGNALYFSRASIPHDRDKTEKCAFKKHLGIYGYRRSVLLDYAQLKPSPLESLEKLEQLRWLANGISIRCVPSKSDSIGVDTEEDLKRVEMLLQ